MLPPLAQCLSKKVWYATAFSLIINLFAVGEAAAAFVNSSRHLPPPVADFHLNIFQGPALTAELKRMAVRNPKPFSHMLPIALKVRTGAEVLKLLDQAGIKRGVSLSGAYMFGSSFAKPDKLDVPRLTREENRFNVEGALRSHGRLVAFVGIDPFVPSAINEMRYWAHKPGVTGVNLHLANSGFKPDSPAQIAMLAHFVGVARKLNLPLIIHVRSGVAYTKADAERFINDVLSHAGNLPVQIAHAGGWGGIDEPTLDALSAYGAAIARKAPGTRNLFFDLALVVMNDKTDPEYLKRFVALMRKIGLDRFVMGSDWPGMYTPAAYDSLVESQLPLTPVEWRQVLGNRAPYLDPRDRFVGR